MGESSAPRRPTHDTNTSRREVKIHTHDNNTSSKQSKYKYTMKFTRLIASTLFLVVLMASTASARSIASPEPQKFCCNAISAQCEACKAGVSVEEICRTWVVDSSDPLSFHSRPLDGCPKKQPKPCCRANTLECQACIAGVSEKEFCRRDPHSHVCPQKPDNKPSHPDNCYSSIRNTEIRHGEMGAKKCCWYGKWENKSKCEKNPPVTHPDNCYFKDLKKEIMHGEVGARNCCWYGKWEKKSKCEKNPPVTHPDNCYSEDLKKEIMHGGMGARNCCWKGDWKHKSKWEWNPSHPHNCYSKDWKKEIMHGEVGPHKCCWYGDWKRKSKCNGGHKDD